MGTLRYVKILGFTSLAFANIIVFYLTLQYYRNDSYINYESYQILANTSENNIYFTISPINDTSTAPPSGCMLKDYSFSDSEVEEYWNYTTYGKCKTLTNDIITIENNIITAICENGRTASFYIDDGKKQELGGKIPTLSWVEKNSLDLKNAEFVMVRCSNECIYSYVFNRFNPDISNKSQNLTNSLSKEKHKPLAVLLLVFDSISRDSARRNLNSSLQYLRENITESKRYSLYDFKYANAAAYNTRPNMVQILYGQTESYHKRFIRKGKSTERKLLLQKDAIWSHYSSLGFVTYFSFDTIFDYLADSTGREITSDHVFTNFCKAGKAAYGYNDLLENQRCFGDRNAHYFSMDHAYQFFENYRNHNRFGYVHITAAHEDTGNVKTIDDDLREFLEKLMRLFDNDEEDFVLFMIGDHGRQNYKLQFKIEGYLDRLIAMTYVIMNKGLEEKINSKEFLEDNLERLIGRFDINLSLKWIANSIYGGYDDNQYQLMKQDYPAKDTVSIFREKVNEMRTCDDIGVPYTLCICRDFLPVNTSDSTEKQILKEITSLAKVFLYQIYQNDTECYTLTEFHIDYAMKLRINERLDGGEQLYNLTLSSKNSTTISVSANISTRKRINKTKQVLDETFHPYKYFYIGYTEFFLQISEVRSENGCIEDLLKAISSDNHTQTQY